jgi:hypothetical protein
MCNLFKARERAYLKAESAFEEALLKEVERLAIRVIETSHRAKSFCMAMGSASFGCQWEEYDDDPSESWEMDENLDPYELKAENSFAAELDKLISEYNDKFKLTGCPMKIDRDHVTGQLVTVTDW